MSHTEGNERVKLRPWKLSFVFIGRLVFLSFLCIIAAIFGYAANTLLMESEIALAESKFDDIANNAISTARKSIFSSAMGAQALSTLYATYFPHASTWPFVYWKILKPLPPSILKRLHLAGYPFCQS